MQQLGLAFLEVSEQAALAAYPWIGSGDKNSADGAATSAMRDALNALPISATIVIGEGELDEAPMLHIGETLGQGGQAVDIAVDPIEGTVLTVNNQENALTTLAIAPRHSLLHAPDMYMKKIAVGPKAKGAIDISAPLATNLKSVAQALGKPVHALNICVQNRPRHDADIAAIRALGAKVQLFEEGDVTYALATALEHLDIDIFIGTGGAPEGVVAAVGLRCLGGEMQAMLLPQSEKEAARCFAMGISKLNQKLTHDELVASDDCVFVATGITDSICLSGTKQAQNGDMTTESLLMTGKDKACRQVKRFHPAVKERELSVG